MYQPIKFGIVENKKSVRFHAFFVYLQNKAGHLAIFGYQVVSLLNLRSL